MSLPDDELVLQARAGEWAAFEALAARYRPCVLALAIDRTGRRDAAEDIAQDALVTALAKLDTLEEPRCFGAWLRQIALNACRMWQRGEGRTLPLRGPEVALTASDVTMRTIKRREDRREIREALLALPENNRLALLLHCVEGLAYDEIADFLGVPRSTIHGRIARARQELRERLGGRLFGALGVSCHEEGPNGGCSGPHPARVVVARRGAG